MLNWEFFCSCLNSLWHQWWMGKTSLTILSQNSQSSVDHRTSLTPSSDTSYLRLVSLTTPGLPQGTSPQPAQHPGYVSLKHQESFFPTRLLLFFPSKPLELLAANSSAWGHDSVPHGEELWSPPPNISTTSKPPPPRTSASFTCVYFITCSVNITCVHEGSRALSQWCSFVLNKHNKVSFSTLSCSCLLSEAGLEADLLPRACWDNSQNDYYEKES